MKALFHIATIITLLLVAPHQQSTQLPEIQLTVDSTYNVGYPVSFNINSSLASTQAVLVIKDSWGLHALPTELAPGTNVIIIPTALTTKSGRVDLELWVNEDLSAKTHFNMAPQNLKQPFPEVYTGPRFLLAGGADEAMMVATPLDSLDNPLPEGTEVNYRVRGRGGDQLSTGVIQGLFTYHMFNSDRQTGIMTAHMTCANSSSPEFDFFVKSAAPGDFNIIQDQLHQEADGQQLVRITTDELTDSLGNVLVDGTIVRFIAESSLGSFNQYSAPTINGVAVAEFPFPAEAQSWNLKALIPGYARSNRLEIVFEPSLKELTAHYQLETHSLVIGPLITRFGNQIADGTKIKVLLKTPDKHSIELITTTRLGMSRVDLASAKIPNGTYDIEFYGGGLKLELNKVTIEI